MPVLCMSYLEETNEVITAGIGVIQPWKIRFSTDLKLDGNDRREHQRGIVNKKYIIIGCDFANPILYSEYSKFPLNTNENPHPVCKERNICDVWPRVVIMWALLWNIVLYHIYQDALKSVLLLSFYIIFKQPNTKYIQCMHDVQAYISVSNKMYTSCMNIYIYMTYFSWPTVELDVALEQKICCLLGYTDRYASDSVILLLTDINLDRYKMSHSTLQDQIRKKAYTAVCRKQSIQNSDKGVKCYR